MQMNENVDFGPCCACEGLELVRNIIMLDVKGIDPGRGWGCLVCGLSMDGAVAVMCDSCMDRNEKIRFAVVGYVAEKRRIPRGELTEPHVHDMSKHPEEQEPTGRSSEMIARQVDALINTSVQDMQSGLWNYTTEDDLTVLRIAYLRCRRRKQTTKCRILKSKIKKLERELGQA